MSAEIAADDLDGIRYQHGEEGHLSQPCKMRFRDGRMSPCDIATLLGEIDRLRSLVTRMEVRPANRGLLIVHEIDESHLPNKSCAICGVA